MAGIEQHRDGLWYEADQPTHCPNGHLYRPRNQTLNWIPCDCRPGSTGHHAYHCWTCGGIVIDPPCVATG